MSDLALGWRLMDRLEALAQFSDGAEGLTRLYLSPSHRRAADTIAVWMREAGLSVRLDAVGTLIGRYEGATAGAHQTPSRRGDLTCGCGCHGARPSEFPACIQSLRDKGKRS